MRRLATILVAFAFLAGTAAVAAPAEARDTTWGCPTC